MNATMAPMTSAAMMAERTVCAQRTARGTWSTWTLWAAEACVVVVMEGAAPGGSVTVVLVWGFMAMFMVAMSFRYGREMKGGKIVEERRRRLVARDWEKMQMQTLEDTFRTGVKNAYKDHL